MVAPTDAVAATATFKRVQVPERVRLLVQGESLINDATGLTAFKVALAAVGASFRPEHALLDFAVATVGGVAVGIAVGWVILYAIRKSPEVEISIVLTVLSAYASYIAAEEIGASGILASAVCGLYAGWRQSEFFDADTRLNAVGVLEHADLRARDAAVRTARPAAQATAAHAREPRAGRDRALGDRGARCASRSSTCRRRAG